MTQKIKNFWDKQAKRYDIAEAKFADVYKDILVKTGKYLALTDYALDFGCATGTKTLELATKVKYIHGIDISTEMINEGIKKKNKLKIPNISFSQGTIYNQELEKTTWDKIIAFGIIHLLEDKEDVIKRIYQLLKPGGIFISTTACMKDKMPIKTRIEVSLYIFLKRLGLFPLHLNMFKDEDVEKLIKENNFQIVEVEKIKDGIPAVFIAARK